MGSRPASAVVRSISRPGVEETLQATPSDGPTARTPTPVVVPAVVYALAQATVSRVSRWFCGTAVHPAVPCVELRQMWRKTHDPLPGTGGLASLFMSPPL